MTLSNLERELVFGISAPVIFKHLRNLCSFGPRPTGSEAEAKAADYLEDQLATYGAVTNRVPFEISHFEVVSSKVEVLLPERLGIECHVNYRSASTPGNGIVTDNIVDVGHGTQGELQEKNFADAIALVTDGQVHIGTLLDTLASQGAVGCIVVRRRPDGLISTHGLHRHGSSIPAVSICYQDGQMLRKFVQEGLLRISMQVHTLLTKGKAENLVGILERQGNSQNVLALVAHYESLPNTLGANDNASGVAVALEMLRIFASVELSCTLWFLFSTGHEGGMMGMFDFVQQKRNELGSIRGLINLDEVGQGPILRALKDGELRPGVKAATAKSLNDILLEVAGDLGYQLDNTYTSRVGGLADAHPFAEAGVPVAWLSKGVGAALYGHTVEDKPDTIEVNALKIPAAILATSLLRLGRAM